MVEEEWLIVPGTRQEHRLLARQDDLAGLEAIAGDRPLRLRIELADRIDRVAEKLDTEREVSIEGKHIENVAAHRVLAPAHDKRHVAVISVRQPRGEVVAWQLFISTNSEDRIADFLGRRHRLDHRMHGRDHEEELVGRRLRKSTECQESIVIDLLVRFRIRHEK